MRVMQVMAGAEHGGAETYYCDAVLALQAAGLEQLAVIRPFPERVERLRAGGVEVATTGAFGLPAIAARPMLRRLASAWRADIVQAWMGRAASLLPRLTLPAIGWFGGYYDLRRYAGCRHFVGVTRDIARHIVAAGAPAERVHTIHTFAALDAAPAADRASLATPTDAPVLLVLSRLHEKKGIDVALTALADLPGAYLWIAGDGELRSDLEGLAARLGVAPRVRFLGWRDDRGALLRAADLCLLPSRYEPFGTVMVEAWAAGVPLVAAAAAGPAAYVRDGETGLLVPVGDATALAQAVRRVRADAALRARLVAGGRDVYRAAFTREAVVAAWLALYRQVHEEADAVAP